jgi:pantetheine-phosphate adenylyltransferase
MEKVAVFPGSFDPITLGHFDVIKRSTQLFDKVIVAVGINADKKYMFSLEERLEFIRGCFAEFEKVQVMTYHGMTIDFCREQNARFLIRGLRNPADFEFEKAIAHTNHALSGIETVFLLTAPQTSFISSTIVRDVIRSGGDYTILVPAPVRIKA